MPSAKRLISVATMWKFFPASPALEASSSALKAIILAWSATELMSVTISQMFSIFSPSDLIPVIVSLFAPAISLSCATFASRYFTPSKTFSLVLFATLATSLTFCEIFSLNEFWSSIVATISLTAALWSCAVAAFSLDATTRFCVSANSVSLTLLSRERIWFIARTITMTDSATRTAVSGMATKSTFSAIFLISARSFPTKIIPSVCPSSLISG